MNKFKPGDRVIFLNEKGGGVVTKIIDDQIVHVAIEDGFEIPYAVGDLLKSGGEDADDSFMGQSSRRRTAAQATTDTLYSIPNKADQRAEGVYLALVPSDQNKPLESRLEFHLLNHSTYKVSFGVFLNQSGTLSGLANGQLDPDSSHLIARVERSGIEDWVNGLVQILFYQDGKTRVLNPASAAIVFKPVKIYKEDSFQYENLIRKNAMVIELATTAGQAQNLRKESSAEEERRLMHEKAPSGTRKVAQPEAKEGFLDKHKVDDQIAEVDLHIGELVDHFSNLSNTDMLRIQMDYFRRCMDQATSDKLKKIIFIHGIGNGTLKNEIMRFLRQTDGIAFHDAPFARYGMGATEVVFYRQRG
ncbi:MAG: DUF2027 domain-containing protein [Bacteroidales bacterium]